MWPLPATAGDTITIKNAAGQIIATAVVAADGTWSATPAMALPEGLNNLSVTATDPAGNVSAPAALPITIEAGVRSVVIAPTAELDPSSDTGTLGDSTTSDTTPTLSGTGTAGDTITITDASGAVIATAVVAADGTWSATPATALPEGLNNLSVTATDPAGNVSAPVALPVTIDSTAPASPTAVLDPSSDTGTLGDSTTSDTTPTLSGTGTAGDTITITDASGAVIATAVVAADGTWSATPATALPEGLTDAAGNVATDAGDLNIDNTVPMVSLDAVAGVQNLSVTSTSSTTPVSVPVTIDTATTIAVTSIAGNTVATTGTTNLNGTFSLLERGFDVSTYTLNSTVTTLPVVSGTTEADVGSTVTLTGAGIPALPGAGVYNVDVTTVVSDGSGGTITRSDISTAELAVLPTAPTISATAWAATGAANTSSLSGIPEGLTGTVSTFAGAVQVTDNTLYNSEVVGSGTTVRVQLPTTGAIPPKVGDVVQLFWGTEQVNHTIVAADLTAKFVDFALTEAQVKTQDYGTITVTSKIVSASGAASALASQDVQFAFDLPLALPASATSPSYGYVINGAGPGATINATNNEWTASGGSVIDVGDMNGDGFDDVLITDSANYKAYVVYGHDGNVKVDTSAIAAGVGSQGFLITAPINYYGFYNWGAASSDINGDGLNDLMITTVTNGAADVRQGHVVVIYGQSGSTTVNMSSIVAGTATSQGFMIADAYPYGDLGGNAYNGATTYQIYGGQGKPTNIGTHDAGDVNGDGINDCHQHRQQVCRCDRALQCD